MKIDILYVGGFGRSGSTLLESVLCQRFDMLGVGEVFFLWDRGFLKNELVGSGVPFHESKFWQRVISKAFGSVSDAEAKEFDRLFQAYRGERINRDSVWSQLPSNLDEFCEVALPLYSAILSEANGRVVVDSSKYPLFGAALAKVFKGRLGFLHMYRDPRAVAFSWSKRKIRAEGGGGQKYMARSKFATSSIWRWQVLNRQALDFEIADDVPRAIVGYENFCASPDRYIAMLDRTFGLGPKRMETIPWESVSGNPARFDGELGEIRLDEAWRSDMSIPSRALVTASCRPLHNHLIARDRMQSFDAG